MKKSLIFIILFLAMCGFTVAQSSPLVPDKVKEIKLLESTRDDVQKILAGYDLYISDNLGFYQEFSSKNETIKIWYSHGECSDDSTDWNIPEWMVIKIGISPHDTITLKDINFNSSGFIKEREYKALPDYHVYHNKNLGIAYDVIENEIQTIYLTPGKETYFRLCNNESVKKFYASKNWFNDRLTWKRRIHEGRNLPANVTELNLSLSEIIGKCPSTVSTESKGCSETVSKIDVSATAEDPENDVLTYNYTVTGGKISYCK